VSEWLVICRHALRNAALPIVTVIGLQFGLTVLAIGLVGDRLRDALDPRAT
jgi:ABC-type dipeptide/oligopeptide/nickel transport system permease component